MNILWPNKPKYIAGNNDLKFEKWEFTICLLMNVEIGILIKW